MYIKTSLVKSTFKTKDHKLKMNYTINNHVTS